MSEIVGSCLSVLAFRMQIYINHRQSGMCGMLLMQAKKRSAIEAALAKNSEPLRVWKSRRSTAAKFPETHSINRIYTDQLL